MPQALSYNYLKETFDRQVLFHEKAWRLSPNPLLLSEEQTDMIKQIGQACLEFYQVLDILYTRSKTGKNLLRNKEHYASWIADYYDLGKPKFLKEHNSHKVNKRSTPSIIRPDLLITEDGFALTELDSVPGGIGLTAFLNQLYKSAGFPVIESEGGMVTGFYNAVVPENLIEQNPLVLIVVSDESATYQPEFIWLSEQLQALGKNIHCAHPDEIKRGSSGLLWRNDQKIDVIYRFFELFDWANVSCADIILEAVEAGEVIVSPPMKTYQEEKMSLAFFHHHALQEFWKENLSKHAFKLLQKIIPQTWIVDPVELPPSAVLDAPWVNGKPIYEWMQLADASQKERSWILKTSGFHESAWGARSVVYGSDSSRLEWEKALRKAITQSSSSLSVLQEYKKPVLLTHEVYDETGTQLIAQNGRVRLCPYFYINNEQSELSGILSTLCPADKKIIHGMSDACLTPCMTQHER
ncbi:MAG: hypothetical protein COZ46_00800 [Verrucomicrobia bacterium CG_4_10_14_3_um_filter_43_23]|nr:MAG: hypothetical protein AUJ82_05735 [Verrucomicrobia bacterium CG1_02_43_26]PIP58716.1 MAG: hypothetical protein COX01_07350 [Verrucomicrobia bacterium CG22_combo_CG10-13_8_21_14_all_43_17]PIX59035.1 MAG: hypothetical protein COZ46_00800 [Verrucomicrobia bacterium CG_4_10_14_3_um_filter_43_23]PIY61617.1 MAG: hypothetical protein COY94_04565 [Verrucomicrobia bacterium CG_4_10_14_0_8_um_filter_43_34]PJA44526.1 MAG: hypothetical protein CO175_02585 [Verrucomicrobia bacterium CG_4_9_14_3_um_fi